jgi:hypothetical protein
MLIPCACGLFLFTLRNTNKALFVVNDTAEQAAWASALQSCEGVLVTLAKLVSHHDYWVGHRGPMADDQGGCVSRAGEASLLCFVF